MTRTPATPIPALPASILFERGAQGQSANGKRARWRRFSKRWAGMNDVHGLDADGARAIVATTETTIPHSPGAKLARVETGLPFHLPRSYNLTP